MLGGCPGRAQPTRTTSKAVQSHPSRLSAAGLCHLPSSRTSGLSVLYTLGTNPSWPHLAVPLSKKPAACVATAVHISWPQANFNNECSVRIPFTLLTLPHPKVRPFIFLFCFGSISTNPLWRQHDSAKKKKKKRGGATTTCRDWIPAMSPTGCDLRCCPSISSLSFPLYKMKGLN